MNVSQVVQNVAREGTVAGTNFVYNEIFIREVLEQVLRNKALGNRLAVPWLTTAN